MQISEPCRRGLLVRSLLVAALVAMVSACGFHLRGSLDLPAVLQATYLETTGLEPRLVRDIVQSLRGNGAQVVSDASQASAILRIRDARFERRALSVDNNADVREFELYYTLVFDLLDARREPMMSNQRVELFRDFTYDKNNILGKSSEEESIRQDMTRDAVQQMLRRLQAGLR